MARASDYLYLTTTGRRTGRAREIEIWFTESDGRFYVIAEHGERAAWVANLRARPAVRVRWQGRTWQGQARVLDPEREPAAWRAARARSEAKYGWGDGLVVEITLAGDAER